MKLGNRKLAVMLIILNICIYFGLLDLLKSEHIVSIITICGPAFFAANLVEHFKKPQE